MTAADTRVGDADVSGRSEGGDISGVRRNRAGWIPESERLDPGIPSSEGGFRSEGLAGAEDLAGEKDIAGAEDIAGAVTIASVGLDN